MTNVHFSWIYLPFITDEEEEEADAFANYLAV